MMKKILNTVLVVSALLLTACTVEKGPVFNPEDAVPSVLEPIDESYELADSVESFFSLNFTPTDFGVEVARSYTAYVDLAGSSFANRQAIGTLNGTVGDEPLSMVIGTADFNGAVLGLGAAFGEPVDVEIYVVASIMGESSVVAGTEVASNPIATTVTPYDMAKVYPKVYVIGDYCGWDHSQTLFLYSYAEDEENYVGVIDFGEGYETNGFKLTGDANWDNGNWGSGSMTSTDPEAPSITLWDDGGSGNITNYSTYRYYSFHFVKSSLTLNMNKGFNQVGIAGDLTGWADGADIVMTQMRSDQRFYADVEFSAAGGFKFRLDGLWDTNWGGTVDAPLSQGGDNISIEAGNYRIYLDLNDWDNPTAVISAEDYGVPVE